MRAGTAISLYSPDFVQRASRELDATSCEHVRRIDEMCAAAFARHRRRLREKKRQLGAGKQNDFDPLQQQTFDGRDDVVFKIRIDYTDFPLDEISLYCVRGTIMLPNEY